MALLEYEVEGRTYLFEDNDVPDGAKLVSDADASVPDTADGADPEPAEESQEPVAAKRGRKPANKAAEPEADKAFTVESTHSE